MAKVYSNLGYIDSVLSYSGQMTTPVNSWSTATTVGSGVSLTYDWMTVEPANPPAGGFRAFTAAEEAGAIAAMALISEVADITFTQDTSGTADIEFGTVSLGGTPAGFTAGITGNGWTIIGNPPTHTYYTDSQVYLTNSHASIGDQTPGGGGFSTMLHEIGHALGLTHTFSNILAPAGTDTVQYSIMSYTDHPGMIEDPRTMMLYDVAALQYLYGANTTTRTGDDTYSWALNESSIMTLWDAGGTDTIDASNQTKAATISLEAGTFSSIGSNGTGGNASNNIAVAYGAVIENAQGGSAADTLTGNAEANVLTGNAGGDTLNGMGGADELLGGNGSDTLYGGDHNDILKGEAAHDMLFGELGDDTLEGGFGNDTVDGGAGIDTAVYTGFGGGITVNLNTLGAQNTGAAGMDTLVDVENILGGDFNDRFTGKSQASDLQGGSGSDFLFGLGGDDILDGGIGNDNVQGGNGNDMLTGGEGRDTLLGGGGTDTLTGGDANDQLRGGAGSDVLVGGVGRDVLIGGDFTAGGFPGDTTADTYVINDVMESSLGGATRDIIRDFEDGLDIIKLDGIDAVAGGADDVFSFVGAAAFSNIAGELRAFNAGANTVVRGDVDGDGVGDLEIFLNGTLSLDAGDFIL